MLQTLRFLLFPFSFLYGLVVALRNFLFDINLLKSTQSKIKSITVGNLNTGGTGKTPFVELLLSHFLKSSRVAVVSRGYGRKTKGLRYVEESDSPQATGDEPLQIKRNFPEALVIVCERRSEAIRKIESEHSEIDLILFDDAFQHRYIRGHCNILLTTYQKPFFKDFILPMGNLREFRSNYKRADLVVVTKCPSDITEIEMQQFQKKLSERPTYFSKLEYSDLIVPEGFPSRKADEFKSALAISGLASNKAFENRVNSMFNRTEAIKFPDHKKYDEKDIREIRNKYLLMNDSNPTCIVTTAKDVVKLKPISDLPLFVLPVKHQVLNEERLFSQIENSIHNV